MNLREKYIDGNLYKVGDIVLNKNNKSIHEIVALGTNYLTVINESGDISKMWLADAVEANSLKEDFDDLRRKRSSSSQIAFAGYKTKNFNSEIYEAFRQTLKENKKDKLALLTLIRQTDILLGTISELNIESYPKIKALLEQTKKYVDKLDISEYHNYRSILQDTVNEFEIMEGYNMTGTDKHGVAHIIADAVKVDVSHHKTAEDKVNACAYHFKSGRHTPEAWKFMGKMLSTASKSGIRWNKDIFAKPTQKAMGLI